MAFCNQSFCIALAVRFAAEREFLWNWAWSCLNRVRSNILLGESVSIVTCESTNRDKGSKVFAI